MATSTNNTENIPVPENLPAKNPADATGNADTPKKQSNLAKIAIILFLLLLTAGACFLIYTFVKQPAGKTGSPELTPAATAPVPSGASTTVAATQKASDIPTSAWEGKYLRSVLPTGWKIIEYENGQGTTTLAEGVNYRGLTGFAVLNNADVKVFTAEAVNGVGGIGCQKIFRFADTDPAYVDKIVAANNSVGITGSIVDLSAKNYFAYTFFGIPVRRVVTVMYYDAERQINSNFFNPACGLDSFAPPLPNGPYFETSSSSSAPVWTKIKSYQFSVNENTDNGDLLKLDEVLKNLRTL